jgi:hypothetical protein
MIDGIVFVLQTSHFLAFFGVVGFAVVFVDDLASFP